MARATLPEDILTIVYKLIPKERRVDQVSFSLVCKRWLRIEGLNRSRIRVNLPELLPNFISRFPNLTQFNTPALITDDNLALLAQTCPNLQILDLNVCRLDEDRFNSDLTDFGHQGLEAIIEGCPHIHSLYLKRRHNIGDQVINSLVSNFNMSENLKELDLRWCDMITDMSLKSIAGLKGIKVLKLDGCRITNRGLMFIFKGSCAKSLKVLHLAHCDELDDDSLTQVDKIEGLEDLNLANCGNGVTNAMWPAIVSIRGLKKLDLSCLMNLTDVIVTAIGIYCDNLEELRLYQCPNISFISL